MEILKIVYAAFKIFLIPTIFVFLAFNATRITSKRNRYIILSIVSFVLLAIFLGAYIMDCVLPHGAVDSYFSPFIYFVLMITSGVYLIISVVFLFINLRNKEKFYKAKPIKKKMIYTVRPKEDYLYVFYRYMDEIYLLKDTHSGIRYKLKRNEFSDDALKRVNESIGVSVFDEIERNGMITVDMGSSDDVFYCYMIDVSERIENEHLETIKMSDVDKAGLLDFDKFVILNCFIKHNFDERY